ARYQSHLAVESHVLASWNQAHPLVARGRRSGRESTTNAGREFLDLKARNGATSLRRRRPNEEDDMARSVTVQTVAGMKAEATTGPHRVIFDAPPEAGGGDEGPSPAEMLLGAIGASKLSNLRRGGGGHRRGARARECPGW